MQFAQHSLYDLASEPSVKSLLLAYFAWAIMSYALKILVIDADDFGYKSVFTSGPLLGLLVYVCINVSIMGIDPTWTIDLVISDVIWGTLLFMMVTLFGLWFKDYL